ncbi:uncharacterized protein PGRI_075100 [Penicillium griseofulvum]|uniref:Uncharacterized protein n=1 Tax=Penicillium patulum TaxID=5078 RepID=A0A135LZH8_PENPA|nr:uncharacterized protein PGRI_075100 [Penicillium griseofulvum]KXG54366.1 hypothetical protein PGRI_075100 [Penicillium griseofulvum]
MSSLAATRRMIRQFLDHQIPAKDLERILEAPEKPEPLEVTSLSLTDVQNILGLTLVVDDDFDSVTPIPVPQDLTAETKQASACKLNLLLVCAHDLVSSSLSKSARPLNIQMERTWAYSPVKWKGKTRMLSGRPDYGIWYGEEEDLDLNVVIMEAKRPNSGTERVPQALAYMGCVHKQRKDFGKADATVYGISTDAMNFTFMKLDNESQWSFKLVGVVGNGFEQVLGLLVYLMTKAALMSPASSKRTSRRTQQGSGESDLTFNHDPETWPRHSTSNSPLATRKIGVVPQDSIMFNASIPENLPYARPSAIDEEIQDAYRAAAILENVLASVNGYNITVGEIVSSYLVENHIGLPLLES